MTHDEREILKFLSPLMEANLEMIIEQHKPPWNDKRYAKKYTAKTLRRMMQQDLITTISELKAWRITKEGREVLNAEKPI